MLTPHPGELSRLTGLGIPEIQRDRLNVARSFATEHQVILVLKGDRTIVAGPDGEAWVNTTGNPAMATGGTGDILTGMVAAMVAQNPHRAFEAVLCAVHLHGLAGDLAAWSSLSGQPLGWHPIVATDLLRTLPLSFPRLRTWAQKPWTRIAGSATGGGHVLAG